MHEGSMQEKHVGTTMQHPMTASYKLRRAQASSSLDVVRYTDLEPGARIISRQS